MISKRQAELLQRQDVRVYVCEDNFRFFFFYYFAKYITHRTPDFHLEMFEDAKFEHQKYLLWVMFRESAKTAIARAFVVWCIVYKKKMNIGWVGSDLRKAAKNARAIANELQVNQKIIQDFDQLYYEDLSSMRNKQSKPKQLLEFKAENGVFFRALSTALSTRGELEDQFRPDLYIFDDIENDKTKKSKVTTQKVISFIEETTTGASVDCDFLFLCNFISKYGSVAHLMNLAKNDPEWKLHKVELIMNGQLVWESRYTQTREQAFLRNKNVQNKKKHIKSVEALRRLGTSRFMQEFMNQPMSDGEGIVKEIWFDEGRGRFSKNNISQGEDGNWWLQKDGHKMRGVTYTAIDPAISKKETSDERAIVTITRFSVKHGVEKNYYCVMNCTAGRWSMKDFAKHLDQIVKKYKPQRVGCESNGVQEAFREIFQMYGLSTDPLNPDTDKVRRLQRHSADIEFGVVLFPDDQECDDLLHELFDFSEEMNTPDNRVDAFSYAMQMCKEGGGFYKNEETEESMITGGIMAKKF